LDQSFTLNQAFSENHRLASMVLRQTKNTELECGSWHLTHKALSSYTFPYRKGVLISSYQLRSNWSEIAIPEKKINPGNKTCFGYPDGYWLR
jgi:hypothetical protein